MINDGRTNFLYLADTLKQKHPEFFSHFTTLLKQHKINFALLPGTKDIWARDYMPIQNSLGEFIRFMYTPDYLQSKKQAETITDSGPVCEKIGIETRPSEIILDGGNVIHHGSKIILCDKIIRENPTIQKKELTEQLRWLLRANQVIYIPIPSDDIFGHADGVVRFVKSNLVFINNYSGKDIKFREVLINVLNKSKIKFIELPYNPYKNKTHLDATGIYINYLEVGKVIFVPVYGMKEDEEALEIFRKVFSKKVIVPVRSNSIAKQGGVLNCISWNLKIKNSKQFFFNLLVQT